MLTAVKLLAELLWRKSLPVPLGNDDDEAGMFGGTDDIDLELE